MATAQPQVRVWVAGDVADVLHACEEYPWPESHIAALVVHRVVELGSGSRLELTRCDGSALHVVVDAAGLDLDGGCVPHACDAVLPGLCVPCRGGLPPP